MFKFLHAADLHIDSPLRGLDRYEGAPVEAIRGATRRAFSNLIQLALDERVDFVVLAGDIYDGNWPDYNTGLFFVKEVRRLDKAGIRVVLIRGNHDAQSRITSKLSYPANVQELPVDRPDTITLEHCRVKVHGQGYAQQAEMRNLASGYPPLVNGWFNIGVLHTSITGREGHETYCPCTVEQLVAHGYDYWALGHVHKRESVECGAQVPIEFPGAIQGRNIRETGPKGCLLVSVDAGRQVNVDFRALDVFRWAVVSIKVGAGCSFEQAVEATADAIEEKRLDADGRPIGVRVELTCEADLFRRLADGLDGFRFELAALAGDQVWIEKVRPRLPATSPNTSIGLAGDAASELHTTLAEMRADPSTPKQLFARGDCDNLRKKLPSDFRKLFDDQHEEIFDLAMAFLQCAPTGDNA